MERTELEPASEPACAGGCVSRRTALIVAGGLTVGLLAPAAVAGAEQGTKRAPSPAQPSDLTQYPRKRVALLSKLAEGTPVSFTYPLEQQPNFLVKLGKAAQGGVGPDRDIVAFSSLCTHMGGNLRGRYRHDLGAIGPCPFHFSTFDLAKGGIPVHASATERLPQITLTVEGDEILAVGVSGLIYGYRHNLKDGTAASGAEPPAGPSKPKTMRG